VAASDLDAKIKVVRHELRLKGVPSKLIAAIATRALRSGRRQTGEFRSNRAPRWTLQAEDPQYATEPDSKEVLLKLYATLLELEGAPTVDGEALTILQESLGRNLWLNSFRDELTLEKLSYEDVVAEVLEPKPGVSALHIGHRDPTMHPRHVPDNVEWRTERSNLLQGNLTLPQARTKFVELIARYFELGEISISPDDPK
jgi:hypothetical protein